MALHDSLKSFNDFLNEHNDDDGKREELKAKLAYEDNLKGIQTILHDKDADDEAIKAAQARLHALKIHPLPPCRNSGESADMSSWEPTKKMKKQFFGIIDESVEVVKNSQHMMQATAGALQEHTDVLSKMRGMLDKMIATS